MSEMKAYNMTHNPRSIALISTDTEGNVTLFNKGAEALLGYAGSEMLGKPSPLENFAELKRQVFNQEDDLPEVLCVHKNGTNVPVHVSTSALKDAQQRVTGLVFVAQERTAPKPAFTLDQMINKAQFKAILAREWRRMQRADNAISLLRVRVDKLTEYNAANGHSDAYLALNQVAATLQERIQRAGDVLSYWGESDFAVLLPATERPGAVKLSEYIRLLVAALPLQPRLTLSVGISTLTPQLEGTADSLVEQAQAGLANAIAEGGNCSRWQD